MEAGNKHGLIKNIQEYLPKFCFLLSYGIQAM